MIIFVFILKIANIMGLKQGVSTKAYGIYSGCIHEGGGCDNTIYLDKNKARQECLKRVQNENEGLTEAKLSGFNFELYTEREPDYWQTRHDCITIQEFDLIE